jgi:hypothetical protein
MQNKDKYIEAEKELAILLHPEFNIEISKGFISYITKSGGYLSTCPKWAREPGAAFQLMTDYDISWTVPKEFPACVEAICEGTKWTENISYNSDKATAVRYAIVMSLVEHLKAKKSKN